MLSEFSCVHASRSKGVFLHGEMGENTLQRHEEKPARLCSSSVTIHNAKKDLEMHVERRRAVSHICGIKQLITSQIISNESSCESDVNAWRRCTFEIGNMSRMQESLSDMKLFGGKKLLQDFSVSYFTQSINVVLKFKLSFCLFVCFHSRNEWRPVVSALLLLKHVKAGKKCNHDDHSNLL